MKLLTIWSLPDMSLFERIRRTRDALCSKIAKILPIRLRYFVTISMIGTAVKESPNIPGTSLEYILNHLEIPKNIT